MLKETCQDVAMGKTGRFVWGSPNKVGGGHSRKRGHNVSLVKASEVTFLRPSGPSTQSSRSESVTM